MFPCGRERVERHYLVRALVGRWHGMRTANSQSSQVAVLTHHRSRPESSNLFHLVENCWVVLQALGRVQGSGAAARSRVACFHSVSISTASLRAMATTAFFLARVPPSRRRASGRGVSGRSPDRRDRGCIGRR